MMESSERGNPTESREFVIARTFDAPRALVFQVWTECEHLLRWWGPKGFTMFSCQLELRPSGIFLYGMRAPDGSELWGRWVFREIVKPERLVFVVSFSDRDGNVTRHPFAPDWPLQTLSTLTFAEHDGKTTVTVRWLPESATELERRTFNAGHDSMQNGWGGTLDQLLDYLEKK